MYSALKGPEDWMLHYSYIVPFYTLVCQQHHHKALTKSSLNDDCMTSATVDNWELELNDKELSI